MVLSNPERGQEEFSIIEFQASECDMVKVYPKDWKILIRLLKALEAHRGERLSFTDVIHVILKPYEKLGLTEILKKIENTECYLGVVHAHEER